MDILSHILIGEIIALPTQSTVKNNLWVVGFSYLPDLPQIILYLYVGFLKKRFLWIPKNQDWYKIPLRDKHKFWVSLWDMPHSFLFWLIVIIPIVFIFNLPLACVVSSLMHLIIDLLTHKGLWAVRPLFLVKQKLKGITNAWEWSFKKIFVS